MKKIMAVVLGTFLMMGVAACGSRQENTYKQISMDDLCILSKRKPQQAGF